MIDLVKGKAVQCDLDGTRSYDRVVSVCRLNGRDIGHPWRSSVEVLPPRYRRIPRRLPSITR